MLSPASEISVKFSKSPSELKFHYLIKHIQLLATTTTTNGKSCQKARKTQAKETEDTLSHTWTRKNLQFLDGKFEGASWGKRK